MINSSRSTNWQRQSILVVKRVLLPLYVLMSCATVSAQAVLFDFNAAPVYSPFPIAQTAGGITANLSSSGAGYSIQAAGVLGFTPAGFNGNIIYPNSINLADLNVHFDQILSDFSLMYACQELGCDDAATMKVTAYLNGSYVGFNTRTATYPGTWPSDTLSCSFASGFDSVVVHYDAIPPTCQDYGTIYVADNMWVTPLGTSGLFSTPSPVEKLNLSNPITANSVFSFSMLHANYVNIRIFDQYGRIVKTIFNGTLQRGEYEFSLDLSDDQISNGIYYLNLSGNDFSNSEKFLLLE